jgi:Glycosyl transferases group 1
MRILVVLVRSLGGPASGRTRAIHSALRSLSDLGHTMHVVAISERTQDPELPSGVTFERLPPPHTRRVAASVLRYAVTARLSLNECLCWSPNLARAIRRIADREDTDLLLADTLRAFPLAAASGFPVVADLDDLLSSRYTSVQDVAGSSRGIALGSYRRSLPPLLRAPVTRLATAALHLESHLVRRREVQIGRQAAAVCLVSSLEAAELGTRVGRPVFWTPPAIPAMQQMRTIASAPGWSAACVGGLDFGPNLQSIRWFRSEVVPLAFELSRGDFRLSVIGHCPQHLHSELRHPAIEFLGYVDRLEPVLSRSRVFVAPTVSGTGLKIKVLDAMARGMPVVATQKAVEGLPVEDRVHLHVAGTAVEFARRLAETAGDGEGAAALGEAGRSLVMSEFSPARAAAGWRSAIASAAIAAKAASYADARGPVRVRHPRPSGSRRLT